MSARPFAIDTTNTFVSLRWIAGPILVVLFLVIFKSTSFLPADIDQVGGIEFFRNRIAVRYVLNRWDSIFLSTTWILGLILVAITYTISPATVTKRIA